MTDPMPRAGRPRQYDLSPPPGYADNVVAGYVAAIDELCERLYDLIGDLPKEALHFVPDNAANSIAMLTLHMIWGEASWVARITAMPIPSPFAETLSTGQQDTTGELRPVLATACELTALGRAVREQYTRPALSTLRNIDAYIQSGARQMTARGVLMHLVWHWTYHSGQVGLLRRMWGARYQWTFGQQIGAASPA